MCGIFALLIPDSELNPKALQKFVELIDRRGPDFKSPIHSHATRCGLKLKLKSSILYLRGNSMEQQPVIHTNGNSLLFNGQIYRFQGQSLEVDQSDTKFLSDRLASAATSESIIDILAAIDGPFAFIYWHNDLNTLFYGRDMFGRKSLCSLNNSDPFPIAISSLAIGELSCKSSYWTEVNHNGITCITFDNLTKPRSQLTEWNIDTVYRRTPRCLTDTGIKYDHYNLMQNKPILQPLSDDPRPACEFKEDEINKAVDRLEERFSRAVSTRIKHHRMLCLNCRKSSSHSSCPLNHSKIAVAFSGGLDSTLIAIALDKVVNRDETLDLATVAFKKDSPDRASVGSAFKEIRKLCPKRNWRLILSDVSVVQLQKLRRDHISNLIMPCDTVLDDSLGCASWFVGRAQGRALDSRSIDDDWIEENFEDFLKFAPSDSSAEVNYPDPIHINYVSPASIMFAGSSIDEQLGGYSTHKTAWKRASTAGLYEEISFLMRRLPSRNLGRDDRIFSDHSRDLKLPYLDYELVSYLNQLPIGLKMDFNNSTELGPKKILRLLALKWGLNETGKRVKRAMQFGTRIANLENPGEKGSDSCSRLKIDKRL